MLGEAYTRGAYTWINTSVKEKVGLSAEGLIRGGLVGGEIRYFKKGCLLPEEQNGFYPDESAFSKEKL